MNRKIILFNGPPGAGRDTAAIYAKHFADMRLGKGNTMPYRAQILAFADPVKNAAAALYCLPLSCKHYENENANWKDTPQPEFYGEKPRNVYIEIAERTKQTAGDDIFGRLACRRIKLEKRDNLFILPDLGFRDEAASVIRNFGVDEVLVVCLHRDGCSYVDDSRSDLSKDLSSSFPSLKIVHLPNNQDKMLLRTFIHGTLADWLNIEMA